MSLPQTLIDRLKEKKVIPFVGAGVSRSILHKESKNPLFPSWSELLFNAADRLDLENKKSYANLVRSFLEIDRPNYLQSAYYAELGLGAAWFDFLNEQFDYARESACDLSLSLAGKIWTLGSNLVITTNYDRALRWSCHSSADLTEWIIEAPAEQAVMMRNGLKRPVIWHLHGSISNSANLILSPDGYQKLYPSPKSHSESLYASALQTLNHLLQSHSFLFIGFSLKDEAFGIQLKAVSETYLGSTGPHYAIVHKNSINELKSQNLAGIEFVAYEDHGKPLLELMDNIANYVNTPLDVSELEESNNEFGVKTEGEIEITTQNFSNIEESDTPPPVLTWVGRNDELELLNSSDSKVVAITGIGGQGKSTLAAKFLKELDPKKIIWDWRDCKEEANTLHTHIVRIIERITGGKRTVQDFVGETTEEVIKVFLNIVIPFNYVFIFDNIDKYVDANRYRTVAPMHDLIMGALRNPGRSKFIFTARPKLDYESPHFLQIELNGLSMEDTALLFVARGVQVGIKAIEEVHELTQGHPLWIGLIANQVIKNRVQLKDLITKIKAGKEAGLPNAMLREVWKTLNPKQQKLLRYLAEAVRPETEQQIALYVARDLNNNQFTKSLKQLKGLDLVVVKSPNNAPDTIELHPLIREFVRRQYSKNERIPYISAIIYFVDRAILALRPNLVVDAPYSTLQNWSAKVDLLVNSGECAQGLTVLDEARRALIANGYVEEFIRLGIGVLSLYDGNDAVISESNSFASVCEDLIESLAHMKRFSESEEVISRFESTVVGATARYVCLCKMRSQYYWLRGSHELAVEWGKRGVDLKQDSNIDTTHDCSHYLALAQRDFGDVDGALSYFLQDEDIKSICNPLKINRDRGAPFYGNIGRCLFLNGKYEDALQCLLKSSWLLERFKDSTTPVNIGWASLWLGETLEKQQKWENAFICYKKAIIKWRTCSPLKADEASVRLDNLKNRVTVETFQLDDSDIIRQFDFWFKNLIKF